MDDCRAGFAGGPMEVRPPPMDGRAALGAVAGTRPFEGVPVREMEALADASCFVGDLVGD